MPLAAQIMITVEPGGRCGISSALAGCANGECGTVADGGLPTEVAKVLASLRYQMERGVAARFTVANDRLLIVNLGGPACVAKRLGFDKKPGGTQRVQNWMARGIPAQVRLDHPDLFMQEAPEAAALKPSEGSAATAVQGA